MQNILNMLDKDDFESSRVHPVGRPPILTSEMIEEICDLVIRGKSIANAAKIRGVSESSIYRWLAIGRAPGAEDIYLELAERMAEALEYSEFEALQTLRIASQDPKNWRVAAWILERRFPEKYGNKKEESEAPVILKQVQGDFEATA